MLRDSALGNTERKMNENTNHHTSKSKSGICIYNLCIIPLMWDTKNIITYVIIVGWYKPSPKWLGSLWGFPHQKQTHCSWYHHPHKSVVDLPHKKQCDVPYLRYTNLVGGIPIPLKNMTSSLGMMTFPTEWKNNIHVPNHQPLTVCVCWSNQRPESSIFPGWQPQIEAPDDAQAIGAFGLAAVQPARTWSPKIRSFQKRKINRSMGCIEQTLGTNIGHPSFRWFEHVWTIGSCEIFSVVSFESQSDGNSDGILGGVV